MERDAASAIISLKLDVRTIKRIEHLVHQGYFKSKSDVIRTAIKAKLEKERKLSKTRTIVSDTADFIK